MTDVTEVDVAEEPDDETPSARAAIWEFVASLIDEVVPEDEEFVVGDLAEKIRVRLEEAAPDVLAEWERQLSLKALMETLTERLRGQRSRMQSAIQRANTEEKIREAVESGDLSPFRQKVCVGNKVWKPVGKLNNEECGYLADHADQQVRYWRVETAFWRQIARRLGKKTIEESMSETEFAVLRTAVKSKVA